MRFWACRRGMKTKFEYTRTLDSHEARPVTTEAGFRRAQSLPFMNNGRQDARSDDMRRVYRLEDEKGRGVYAASVAAFAGDSTMRRRMRKGLSVRGKG